MNPNEDNPIGSTVDATLNANRPAGGRYVTAVQKFVDASPWLTDEHAPALALLEGLAEQLDQRMTGAIAAQYGVTFRDLRAQSPHKAAAADDPIAALLDKAGKL